MAFSQGKESSQSSAIFRRFVGIGAMKVVATNPTMDEWNKITGGNVQKEPEYVTTNAEGIKQARVTLLLQTDPKRTIGEIDTIIPVTFWFSKTPVQGSQSGKYRIIDKYGQCAWATKEEIEAKKIPQYSNGPANIDADYRLLIRGEEEFTNFLRAYLSVPNPRIFNKTTNAWEVNPHLDECEARIDNIKKIFDGDFKEIKSIISLRPNNHCKILFGVKTTEDGKEYQDVFTGVFVSERNPNNTVFAKELKKQTDLGRYKSTYFGDLNANGEVILSDLREYIIPATELEPTGMPAPTVESDTTFDAKNDDLPF